MNAAVPNNKNGGIRVGNQIINVQCRSCGCVARIVGVRIEANKQIGDVKGIRTAMRGRSTHQLRRRDREIERVV